jgi:hypothetical protein
VDVIVAGMLVLSVDGCRAITVPRAACPRLREDPSLVPRLGASANLMLDR